MVILRKPCFYCCKSKVFDVQRVQKSMRNRSENHAKTRLEKVMQKWSKMMPKWNQNGSKNYQNGCQKSMRKSMRKSMQNGTLKRRVGARGVSSLSSTQSPYLVVVSQYHIPQCAVDSYIRPQPNPQNGPSAPLRGCAAGSTSQATTGRACCALYIRNGRKECKKHGFRGS